MDDLISRQDAIKNAHFPMIDDAGYEVVRVDDILALPPAKPKTKCIAQIRINRDDMEDLVNKKVNEIVDKMVEPKMGEWVDIDNYYRMATCSYCHKVTMFEKWGKYTKPYNYCPNCGADMSTRRMVKHEPI